MACAVHKWLQTVQLCAGHNSLLGPNLLIPQHTTARAFSHSFSNHESLPLLLATEPPVEVKQLNTSYLKET